MTIPEPGRLAAHVLIDAISSGGDGWNPDDPAAVNLALERTGEVGAVSATIDDDAHVTVDASDLIGGALTSMQWLITQLALPTETDEAEVLVNLRGGVDQA